MSNNNFTFNFNAPVGKHIDKVDTMVVVVNGASTVIVDGEFENVTFETNINSFEKE